MAKKIIGLCACPMGLAHTFMAAEALEKAAKEKGYDVKIETQGADGIQNKLTADDIKKADIIIHSVGITPEGMDRFEGYEVYEVELQELIKNPKGILEEIEEDKGCFKVIGEVIVGVIAALIWMGGCAFEFLSALVRRRRPNLFLPPQLPDDPAVRMLVGLAIGFLPAAIIGVMAHGFIKSVLFETPKLICVMLILGGIVLLWIDKLDLKPKYHEVSQFPLSLYLKIGFFQCLP